MEKLKLQEFVILINKNKEITCDSGCFAGMEVSSCLTFKLLDDLGKSARKLKMLRLLWAGNLEVDATRPMVGKTEFCKEVINLGVAFWG